MPGYDAESIDFEKIFNLSPILLGITTLKDGKYVKVNRQFLDYLKFKEEDVIGKNSDELGIFAEATDSTEIVDRLKKDGFVKDMSLRIKTINGKIDVLISAEMLGKELILVSVKDINIVRETEKALRLSEESYRQLFESVDNCIAIYEARDDGADFIIKNFNPAAEKIENVKKEDIIGKSVLKVFPGVREFGLFEVFQRVWRTGKSETHPVSLYKDDTLSSWRENYVYKLPNGDVVAIYEDITERKNAVEELYNSRELLNRVINLLPMRIFWKDTNLFYLGCNTLFAKDAGKNAPEELIGKDDFHMSWKDQAEIYRKDDFDVITSGKPKINFEEPQTTPDGNTIWLRTSKVPLTDMHGNIKGILGMYDDITERKKAEQELLRSKQESDKLNSFAVDRELKMIELKKEINELMKRLGEKPKYLINSYEKI